MQIVHRDVSPQNILISFEGEVKLIDFGIAKAATKASTTDRGALRGKLLYMSPEQAWGRPIDRRSDVFSLGIVLYEMVTETKPFLGAGTEMSILELGARVRDHARARDQPARPRGARPRGHEGAGAGPRRALPGRRPDAARARARAARAAAGRARATWRASWSCCSTASEREDEHRLRAAARARRPPAARSRRHPSPMPLEIAAEAVRNRRIERGDSDVLDERAGEVLPADPRDHRKRSTSSTRRSRRSSPRSRSAWPSCRRRRTRPSRSTTAPAGSSASRTTSRRATSRRPEPRGLVPPRADAAFAPRPRRAASPRGSGQVRELQGDPLPQGRGQEPLGVPEVRLPLPHLGARAARPALRRRLGGVRRRPGERRPARLQRHQALRGAAQGRQGQDRLLRRAGLRGRARSAAAAR